MPRFEDIQFRRGTAAEWFAVNPVLDEGEPGFETDTGKLKFGDGSSTWNGLSYFVGGAGPAGADGPPGVGVPGPPGADGEEADSIWSIPPGALLGAANFWNAEQRYAGGFTVWPATDEIPVIRLFTSGNFSALGGGYIGQSNPNSGDTGTLGVYGAHTTTTPLVVASGGTAAGDLTSWKINTDLVLALDKFGKLQWADGVGGARDTNLYRSAAGVLTTDGDLTLPGGLLTIVPESTATQGIHITANPGQSGELIVVKASAGGGGTTIFSVEGSDSGTRFVTANAFKQGDNGVSFAWQGTNDIRISATGVLVFSGTANATDASAAIDAGIARVGPSVLRVTDGTVPGPSGATGDLIARNLIGGIRDLSRTYPVLEAQEDYDYPWPTGGGAAAAAAAAPSAAYATSIGDGASTSFNVDHALGTLDVQVAIYRNSTGAEIEADITRSTVNRVVVAFVTTPSSNEYRVVVR